MPHPLRCHLCHDHLHGAATVLQGTRSQQSGLSHTTPVVAPAVSVSPPFLPLIQPSSSSLPRMALSARSTFVNKVAFYHAAMLSPTSVSIWCKAIDAGFLTTSPYLTSAQVRRHLPVSAPMVKGHLDQQHANLCSTSPIALPSPYPSQSHHLFVKRLSAGNWSNTFRPNKMFPHCLQPR